MVKPRVFVTRRRVPEAVALLERSFEVEAWSEGTPPPKEVVVDRAGGCDAMMVEADDTVDEQVLEAGKESLKIVATRAVGMDNIDVPAATARGIIIANTPECRIDGRSHVRTHTRRCPTCRIRRPPYT